MAETKVKAVFNAARRYCVDRIEAHRDTFWLSEAVRLGPGVREELKTGRFSGSYRVARLVEQTSTLPQAPGLSSEDRDRLLDTMHLLEAILREIEQRVADDFPTVTATRTFLIAAGHRAKAGYYQFVRKDSEVAWQYVDEKRDEARTTTREQARSDYLDYLTQLSPEEAALAPAVPFRQVMSDIKRLRVGTKLANRWAVDPSEHYWYPLNTAIPTADVFAAQAWYFDREVGDALLSDILLQRGITRVWEVHELRRPPEYELSPSLCAFEAYETYWSSKELDWLVYTSHEASITFAGSWLVEEIKRVWENWEQRVYSSWDYERSFP
jgi:hypothetical protein